MWPICKTISDEREITRDIGDHYITHMLIENGVIPSLEVVAPRLTHLRISGITESSQLQRYVDCYYRKYIISYRTTLTLVSGRATEDTHPRTYNQLV